MKKIKILAICLVSVIMLILISNQVEATQYVWTDTTNLEYELKDNKIVLSGLDKKAGRNYYFWVAYEDGEFLEEGKLYEGGLPAKDVNSVSFINENDNIEYWLNATGDIYFQLLEEDENNNITVIHKKSKLERSYDFVDGTNVKLELQGNKIVVSGLNKKENHDYYFWVAYEDGEFLEEGKILNGTITKEVNSVSCIQEHDHIDYWLQSVGDIQVQLVEEYKLSESNDFYPGKSNYARKVIKTKTDLNRTYDFTDGSNIKLELQGNKIVASGLNKKENHDYYFWVAYDTGEFLEEGEILGGTIAKEANSVSCVQEHDTIDYWLQSVGNIQVQLVEEYKLVESDETSGYARKVIKNKTDIVRNYDFTDTTNLKFELKDNKIVLSNLNKKDGHKYYLWVAYEDGEFLEENKIFDGALPAAKVNSTSFVNLESDDISEWLKSSKNIQFQLVEEYNLPVKWDGDVLPGNSNVARKVILNKTNLVEKKEEEKNYTVLEGNNQTYSNNKENLTVKFSAPAEELVEVAINDEKLDSKYYTVESGSTIITVKNDYLKTLQSGTYTLTAKYENGKSIDATFKVAETENENDNTQAKETIPQAGNNLIGIVVVSALSIVVVYVLYKKYKSIVIK